MTQENPERPMVFQPFGFVTHPDHAAVKRLWGVCGVSLYARIEGLTREEAHAVSEALSKLRDTMKEAPQ